MREIIDHWTIRAKKEGYPARSVYKLKEIDEKFSLLRKNYRVMDLGAAPGSWTTYLLRMLDGTGHVTAVDLAEAFQVNGLCLAVDDPDEAVDLPIPVFDLEAVCDGIVGGVLEDALDGRTFDKRQLLKFDFILCRIPQGGQQSAGKRRENREDDNHFNHISHGYATFPKAFGLILSKSGLTRLITRIA